MSRFVASGLPLLASGLLLGACAQIVGIGDTTVAVDGGANGPDGATSGGEGGSDSGGGGGGPDATIEGGGGPDGAASADGEAGTADGPQGDGPALAEGGGGEGGGSSGGGGVDAGCDGAACWTRGPAVIPIPTPTTYYVDSTEVTVAQYRQFLAAKGSDTSGQPAVCAWNTAYWGGGAFDPDNYPITSVDWCDATAFCSWAGKHLCGAIGGGAVASASALDQTKSQWFLACGGPGGASHPNNSSVCNSSSGNGGTAPVATYPGCEGHYAGLFDLEGNVAEWIDSCDLAEGGANPQNDQCYLAGGNWIDSQSYCDEDYSYPRSETAPTFGFRCCAE